MKNIGKSLAYRAQHVALSVDMNRSHAVFFQYVNRAVHILGSVLYHSLVFLMTFVQGKSWAWQISDTWNHNVLRHYLPDVCVQHWKTVLIGRTIAVQMEKIENDESVLINIYYPDDWRSWNLWLSRKIVMKWNSIKFHQFIIDMSRGRVWYANEVS